MLSYSERVADSFSSQDKSASIL